MLAVVIATGACATQNTESDRPLATPQTARQSLADIDYVYVQLVNDFQDLVLILTVTNDDETESIVRSMLKTKTEELLMHFEDVSDSGVLEVACDAVSTNAEDLFTELQQCTVAEETCHDVAAIQEACDQIG
ncbi:MAG: hypothetical protein AAFY56_24270 [Pseudomonadota bacterium]